MRLVRLYADIYSSRFIRNLQYFYIEFWTLLRHKFDSGAMIFTIFSLHIYMLYFKPQLGRQGFFEGGRVGTFFFDFKFSLYVLAFV